MVRFASSKPLFYSVTTSNCFACDSFALRVFIGPDKLFEVSSNMFRRLEMFGRAGTSGTSRTPGRPQRPGLSGRAGRLGMRDVRDVHDIPCGTCRTSGTSGTSGTPGTSEAGLRPPLAPQDNFSLQMREGEGRFLCNSMHIHRSPI